MSDFADALDYDAIEALRRAADFDGRLHALTTGVAGGDHWYICDEGETIAYVSACDGVDEAFRQPRAELIVTAVNNIPALIARCRELEAKVAEAREYAEKLAVRPALYPQAGWDIRAILDGKDPT